MENRSKPCPLCGRLNNPILLECAYCEADLSNVSIRSGTEVREKDKDASAINDGAAVTDGSAITDGLAVTDGSADKSGDGLHRVCECGYVNRANARKCGQCGEDISDILPAKQRKNEAQFGLEAVGAADYFPLSEGKITIGRMAQMADYLKDKSYVSRIHARLSVKEDSLCIENLSQTNYTYVNDNRVMPGEVKVLKEGDEIGLGGWNREGSRQSQAAYFVVVKKNQ